MAASLYDILLRSFLVQGKAQALPMIPSAQLRAGLITIEEAKGRGKLHVPHYWALYIHDGRGPAPGGGAGDKILVWFKDPANDPRYPGGIYPVRLSDRKSVV